MLGDGPVQEITLADGHHAFLVLGYDAARDALNHPDLSKDMLAALDGRRRGRRRAARPRLRPAHAQRRPARPHPAAPLWPRPPSPAAARRAGAPHRRIVDGLLDESPPSDPAPVDLVAGFALPLPFAVIGELLGIAEAGPAAAGPGFAVLLRPTTATLPPPEASTPRTRIVAFLNELVDQRRPTRPKTSSATSCERAHGATGSTAPRTAVHAVPAHRGRTPHHDEPHRQRHRRAAAAPGQSTGRSLAIPP